MATLVPPAASNLFCALKLSGPEQSCILVVSLGESFRGGNLFRLVPNAVSHIEPRDATAESYSEDNWFAGMMSGARYAFRALKSPLRNIDVWSMEGHLAASATEPLAHAAASAVSKLLDKELAVTMPEGWACQTEMTTSQTR